MYKIQIISSVKFSWVMEIINRDQQVDLKIQGREVPGSNPRHTYGCHDIAPIVTRLGLNRLQRLMVKRKKYRLKCTDIFTKLAEVLNCRFSATIWKRFSTNIGFMCNHQSAILLLLIFIDGKKENLINVNCERKGKS